MRKYGLILILFLLSGCFENESVEQIKGESMGTSYTINVLGDDKTIGKTLAVSLGVMLAKYGFNLA